MFNNKRSLEVMRLELADMKRQLGQKQQLLDFAQGCMDYNKVCRERDEARAELKKVKSDLFVAEEQASSARNEVRRLETKVALLQSEPQRYVVQTDGREVSVTAYCHDELSDTGPLLLMDQDETLVASFNTYTSYRIEPVTA